MSRRWDCASVHASEHAGAAWTVHLVVAYDRVWNLIGVAGSLALRGRGFRTLIFWLASAWYAVGRFLLGFLRTVDPTYVFGLREDQIIGLLVLAAAIPMIIRLTVFRRAPEAVAA